MQTESSIHTKTGDVSINITPGELSSFVSLEVSNLDRGDTITIIVFTEDRVDFLELLKKVTDECLLRVKDNESKGERDDA